MPPCGAGMRVSEGRSGRGEAERGARGPRDQGPGRQGGHDGDGTAAARGRYRSARRRSLKKRCGSGGTVRAGVIEIQGDHRDAIVAELIKTGLAGQESRRLSAADRVSCAHRDKSCLESVLLTGGPPKAQPPGNAQAHELQSLAISGERSRRAARSTEGEQRCIERSISQVSRTEGRHALKCGPSLRRLSQRGCDGPEDSALRHPCCTGRQDRRFRRLGHAAAASARRSRSITRCAGMPGSSMSRTCASST